MMEDLVRAVSSRWAGELDFSTLTRLSSEYISAGRTHRYGDMLWEAALLDRRGSVLITLEFQNTVDREMPLRVLDYGSSALLDWAAASRCARGDKAPLLLPYSRCTEGASPGTFQRVWPRLMPNDPFPTACQSAAIQVFSA